MANNEISGFIWSLKRCLLDDPNMNHLQAKSAIYCGIFCIDTKAYLFLYFHTKKELLIKGKLYFQYNACYYIL